MTEETPKPQRRVNFNTWIILGCVLLLTAVMSISMYYMITHVRELTGSPFVYGAQKTSELYDGADVMCSCRIGIPTTNSFGRETVDPNFYFNTTGTWTDKHERRSIAQDFNASAIQRLFNSSISNNSG